MSTPGDGSVRAVELRTSDGFHIPADVHEPRSAEPVAGVVLSPPHPHFGGDRQHPLLVGLAAAAAGSDLLAIRHDFRDGPADTIAERGDVAAAVSWLRAGRPDLPVVAIGYSFGALVALGAALAAPAGPDGAADRIDAVVAIAPPLAPDHVDLGGGGRLSPVHLVVPRHDQFCPPESLARLDLGATTTDIVEGADHFLAGHLATVVALTLAAATRLVGIADGG